MDGITGAMFYGITVTSDLFGFFFFCYLFLSLPFFQKADGIRERSWRIRENFQIEEDSLL